MKVEEIALKALKVYGGNNKIIKTIEELSECSAALARCYTERTQWTA